MSSWNMPVRVGVHELVAPADPRIWPAGSSGSCVELPACAAPPSRSSWRLLSRRDLALARARSRASSSAALDALALGLQHVVELLLDVLQRGAEVVALELLLPLLAELLEQVLQAGHLRPSRVCAPCWKSRCSALPQVAVRQEVVGHGLQQVVGVQIGDVLRAVPARVAEEHGIAAYGSR